MEGARCTVAQTDFDPSNHTTAILPKMSFQLIEFSQHLIAS